jgi:hypothetical protein
LNKNLFRNVANLKSNDGLSKNLSRGASGGVEKVDGLLISTKFIPFLPG